mmetsp:Transcript_23885/g.76807  ORF Transcript_23885/g.76807 Transcript_23885/m.76807 type:complete len:204 (+) Transcript_23885:617-1228(+)
MPPSSPTLPRPRPFGSTSATSSSRRTTRTGGSAFSRRRSTANHSTRRCPCRTSSAPACSGTRPWPTPPPPGARRTPTAVSSASSAQTTSNLAVASPPASPWTSVCRETRHSPSSLIPRQSTRPARSWSPGAPASPSSCNCASTMMRVEGTSPSGPSKSPARSKPSFPSPTSSGSGTRVQPSKPEKGRSCLPSRAAQCVVCSVV